MEYNITAINEAEEAVASILIEYTKSNRINLHENEIALIEDCFKLSGCYDTYPEGIIPRKRIEAYYILRSIITSTKHYEFKKAEKAMLLATEL